MATFTDGYGGDVNTAKDARLNGSQPTYNYGSATTLQFGTSHNPCVLIEFDLTDIPAGATCNSATLSLFNIETKTSNRSLVFYMVASANADWTEGSNSGSLETGGNATWNYKAQTAADAGTAWAGSAGLSTSETDYDATSLGTMTYTANDAIGTENTVSLDTSQIAAKFGGKLSIIFWSTNTFPTVASSDNATTGYRPKLVVDYTATTPVTISMGAASISAGAQALSVDLGSTTINLGSATVTASAQAMAAQVGTVSINLGSAGLTASAQDVTACYTYTDGYGGDVNTACDLQIASGWPTYNGGAHANLSFESGQRSLIRFNLSSIPASATCVSAILYLVHSYSAEGGGTVTIPVHSVSQANGDWIEGTKDIALASAGEPCWNAKEADGSGGVQEAWAGSAGCSTSGTDYEATAIGQFVFNSGSDIGTEFAVTLDADRVAGWFGSSNTNYGITFVQPSSAGHVGSSDNSNTAYRPKLVVLYHPVTADQTINLGSGSITAAAQALDVTPGQASVNLGTCAIAAAAQGMSITAGEVTVEFNTAGVTAAAQIADIIPGSVTNSLGAGSVTAIAQTMDLIAGETSIPLGTANLVAGAQGIALSTGAVSISLGSGGITASAQGCSLIAGAVTISLGAGGITTSIQILSVAAPTPGTVLIHLGSATLTATGHAASLAAGAVTLALSATNLAAGVQGLVVSAPAPGISISLGVCWSATTAQGLSTVPGEATLSLGTGEITATGPALTASAGTIPPTQVNLEASELSIAGQAFTAAPGGVVIGLDPATVAATALVIAAASLIARFLAITDGPACGLAVEDQQRCTITLSEALWYTITLEDEG